MYINNYYYIMSDSKKRKKKARRSFIHQASGAMGIIVVGAAGVK